MSFKVKFKGTQERGNLIFGDYFVRLVTKVLMVKYLMFAIVSIKV